MLLDKLIRIFQSNVTGFAGPSSGGHRAARPGPTAGIGPSIARPALDFLAEGRSGRRPARGDGSRRRARRCRVHFRDPRRSDRAAGATPGKPPDRRAAPPLATLPGVIRFSPGSHSLWRKVPVEKITSSAARTKPQSLNRSKEAAVGGGDYRRHDGGALDRRAWSDFQTRSLSTVDAGAPGVSFRHFPEPLRHVELDFAQTPRILLQATRQNPRSAALCRRVLLWRSFSRADSFPRVQAAGLAQRPATSLNFHDRPIT